MPECLHVLLEGQVALSSTAADGTTALVEVIHPIEHFVMASMLSRLPTDDRPYCYPVRLLAIDAAGLRDWWKTSARWRTRCCARCRASSAPWCDRCAT